MGGARRKRAGSILKGSFGKTEGFAAGTNDPAVFIAVIMLFWVDKGKVICYYIYRK